MATASCTRQGAPYERLRWRQFDHGAERVPLTVRLPQVAETYYACCSQIDRHNRCRQDDLCLERKLVTHDWAMRVCLTLLGVYIVDAWLMHRGARGPAACLLQSHFYEQLATELMDNTFDTSGTRERSVRESARADAPSPDYGVGAHLTPTVKRRRSSAHLLAQRTCRVCSDRTSLVCSTCRDTPAVGEVFLCGPRTGRFCFAHHMRDVHHLTIWSLSRPLAGLGGVERVV